jgi:hypothetical protein
MGGEYMRVLDTLPSLRGACSTYQRQAPGAVKNKQRLSLLPMPLSPILVFTKLLLPFFVDCRYWNFACTDLLLVLTYWRVARRAVFHSYRHAPCVPKVG